MYTREQVEKAILELWNEGEPEEYQIGSYDGDALESGEAEQVLIDLGVPDAEERIEWYNVTRLDAEDILSLSNVEFRVETCDRCGERKFIGEPKDWDDFQGVLQDDDAGTYEVMLEPFGACANLCSDCIGELLRVFKS